MGLKVLLIGYAVHVNDNNDQVDIMIVIGSFEEIPLLEASPISENLFFAISARIFTEECKKMHAFSWKCKKMH